MTFPKLMRWATAYGNEDFISINTCSGMRSYAVDPKGERFFISVDAGSEQLGQSIRESLLVSRFLSPEELSGFFDVKVLKNNYEDWVAQFMEVSNVNSRKSLFKQMIHCKIESDGQIIKIKPTNHEKLESWSGKRISEDMYEVLDFYASDVELGNALRQSLDKCL